MFNVPTIQTIYSQIDKAIEDSKSLAIICNEYVALIVQDYLKEFFGMKNIGLKTLSRYPIAYSQSIIVIDSVNYEYNTIEVEHKDGKINSLSVDNLVVIGNYLLSELSEIKFKYIHQYDNFNIKPEEIHWNQIADNEDADEGDIDEECDCDDTDCNECDCEDCSCCEDMEECTCDVCENIDYEVGLIIDTTNKILQYEGCPDSIFDLIKLFGYKMKAIGWNNCVEYHRIEYDEDENDGYKH